MIKINQFIKYILIILCISTFNVYFNNAIANHKLTSNELQNIATNNTPKNLTIILANSTFNSIKKHENYIKKDPNILIDIVKDKLIDHVNVPYIGAIILGNYYRTVSEKDRELYYTALRKYIINSYAQVLTLYKGQEVNFGKENFIGNKNEFATVNLVIKSESPIRIDFKWRKNTKTGQWQVYDLVAEGVSLVSAKNAEWTPILRNKGILALTKIIEEQSKANIKPSK